MSFICTKVVTYGAKPEYIDELSVSHFHCCWEAWHVTYLEPAIRLFKHLNALN